MKLGVYNVSPMRLNEGSKQSYFLFFIRSIFYFHCFLPSSSSFLPEMESKMENGTVKCMREERSERGERFEFKCWYDSQHN